MDRSSDTPAPRGPTSTTRPVPTVGLAPPPASIEEPPRPQLVRRPFDLIRAVGWLAGCGVLLAVGSVAIGTTSGLETDLTSAVTTLPDLIVSLLAAVGGLLLLALPVVLVADLVIRRRWQALVIAVLASLTVFVVTLVLSSFAADWFSATLIDAFTTSTGGHLSPFAFPGVAAIVAFATVDGLAGRPRLAAIVWGFVIAYVILLLFNQSATPLALALSAAMGRAFGLGFRYGFGSANPQPSGAQVAAALTRVALPLAHARLVTENDEGRTYQARTLDGRPLTLKVYDRDRRAAGIFYQLWRRLRVQRPVERRPALSLRRAVDQAALPTLAARGQGIRTPTLVAAAAVGPDAAVIAYESVDGLRTFADLEPDDLTEDLVANAWHQVRLLHRAGIAHEELHADNLAVDPAGQTWVLGLDSGEIAADTLTLRIDDAEMLVTTALLLGPDRAVTAALVELTPKRLGEALPLLQTIALSRTTRTALRQQRGLLADLRDAVIAASPTAPTEPVRLERLRPRAIMSFLAFGLAVFLLLGQLGNVDLVSVFTTASRSWFVVALAFSLVTYLGATMVITSFSPVPLMWVRTLMAQFAATFVALVAPPAVGTVGTNTRYIQQAGATPSLALASVGVSQVFVFGSYLLLIFGFGFFTTQQQETAFIPGRTVVIVVVTLAIVAALVFGFPFTRRAVLDRLRPLVDRTLPRLITMLREPRRLGIGLVGALTLNIAYSAALWSAQRAYGGTLGFATVGFVYLAAGAIGSAAPTPGGIGAVEAALAAGLTAAGLDASTAVSAALLFRACTFWIPMVPGWLSFNALQRRGAL
ncbi:MAG: lysylphosphatidylglycerol synthase transmembrane domain-containing protein [Actinomycetes bacterium]